MMVYVTAEAARKIGGVYMLEGGATMMLKSIS
jgi:hypothetical protein